MTPEQEQALAALGGDKYADNPRQWYAIGQKMFRQLGYDKAPPGHVLDIGAGFGYYMHLMASWGWDVLALEPPGDVGITYQKACAILGVPCVAHLICKEDVFPEGVGTFDLILKLHVTAFFWDTDADAMQAVGRMGQAMYRHLNPGGTILVRPLAGRCMTRWCGQDWPTVVPGSTSQIETYNGLHKQVWIRKPEVENAG